ncbi:GNAT family N-acetyltransferase [Pseudomonas sp. 2FE]|uniref:GNAT family N-acetyltransferase n=1 Tax=Pseudomonas sp. 2FE TaxID=2502190 RepID=UPI0010F787C0|nr:GNAT family N-acetyltransferase [Pseudomonas sp. 2FE]
MTTTGIQPTPQDKFLPGIFRSEAKALVSELHSLPTIFAATIALSDEDAEKGLKVISDIFGSCYRLGHLQMAILSEGDELYGYAMIFMLPGTDLRYLHKIHVLYPYRGQGLGSILLRHLLTDPLSLSLICPPDKVPFYQRNGLRLDGPVAVPGGEGFSLSEGLYSGAVVMSNSPERRPAPIFMLNDKDIRAVFGL